MPGCAPSHRQRQRRQPRGAWRTSLADCHSALPEHIGHPTRTQPSRSRDADGKRLAHHVRRGRQPTRSTYDFRAEGRICQLRQRGCVLWSQLAGRDVTSPLFHLPFRMGGLGVGSAVQRHAAAPWTAWHSIIPTLMQATDSPETDSLFASTPILRGQLHHLKATFAQQMNTPSPPPQITERGTSNAWVSKSTGQHDPTNDTPTTISKPFKQPHPEGHPPLSNSQKHRRAPTATQQRSLRGGRQMFPSLTHTPTHASPSGCEQFSQHLAHAP